MPTPCLEEWGGHDGFCNYLIMNLLRKYMCPPLPSTMVNFSIRENGVFSGRNAQFGLTHPEKTAYSRMIMGNLCVGEAEIKNNLDFTLNLNKAKPTGGRDRSWLTRRCSAATLASARFSEKIEAAMAPDPNEVSGRHAPRGCRRSRLGVDIVSSFFTSR